MAFSDKQIYALQAPLDRSHVKGRKQGGTTVSYIEGWHAIAEANRIFGFDSWKRETVDIRVVSEAPREIGQYKKPGWGVTYIARVRITVGDVVREGVGAGHGIDTDLGQAHESAIKEAETDAMKRALMTFGNPFGLALYDKTQANVSDGSEKVLEREETPFDDEKKKDASKPDANAERIKRDAKAILLAAEAVKPDEWDAFYDGLLPRLDAIKDASKNTYDFVINRLAEIEAALKIGA